jgi:8-oxo-dGTP pyrophosphatase MutT (NUDIX family)
MLGRTRRAGDGFVTCRCGQRHWGRFGAAGLLLVHEGSVLLQHRVAWSHHGGTWALPGGAVDTAETAWQAALREADEEAGVPAAAVRPKLSLVEEHADWRYTTVVATAACRVPPRIGDAESIELAWVDVAAVTQRPLHPAFAAAWPTLQGVLDAESVLVVDAANVVGSRPDGWWRDRAGATSRLLARLDLLAAAGVPALGGLVDGASPVAPDGTLDLARQWPQVVAVVEGQARAAASTPLRHGVQVVAAPADGDSTIAGTAQQHTAGGAGVTVVTADRGLRARLPAQVHVVGPAALLAVLDELAVP